MINISRFQLWSALLVCLLSILFAAPNVLPETTAKRLPSSVPHQQFNLGLDLRGGAYLLLEADMKTVLDENLKDMRNQLRQKLREEKVNYKDLRVVPRGVSFRVPEQRNIDKARDVATRLARDIGGTIRLISLA